MINRIIDKAAELFLTYGVKSVTMDDIANALAISKKTIYVHFENKTKLIEAVAFSVFENICHGIDNICENTQNPIEQLYDIEKLVNQILKNEKTSPQHQLKKFYPHIYQRLQKKQFEVMHVSVRESLEKGIKMGLFRTNIDIDFISRMYFTGMSGIREEFLFPKTNFVHEQLTQNFLEYHLRAIVTDQGLEVLKKFITKQS